MKRKDKEKKDKRRWPEDFKFASNTKPKNFGKGGSATRPPS